MKFGKLPDVTGVDFTLPADPPSTQRLLDALPVGGKPRYYLGGTQWGRAEWIGQWYPKGAKPADFLKHYARQFNTIELNATHYRIFPESTVRKWYEQAPDGFRFCPKWPQSISHRRRFQHSEDMTEGFLRSILQLEDKLGPCFIQLPPHFSPTSAEVLLRYLDQLPRDLRLAVEFRHPDWFTASPEVDRVFEALQHLGIGTCLSDTAGRRDAVHQRLTADFFLLRFVGNELHPSDAERMQAWAERLADWTSRGLQEVYVFMHQPDSILTPEASTVMARALNERGKAGLQPPKPEEMQGSLFG